MIKLHKEYKSFSLWSFTNPTDDEILHLKGLLQEADRTEVSIMFDCDVQRGLRFSVENSTECYLILSKKFHLCGVIGIDRMNPEYDVPWFLSTIHFHEIAKPFSRWAKEQCNSSENLMVNYVYSEYTIAMRWLEWLGFTIDDQQSIKNDQFYLAYKQPN